MPGIDVTAQLLNDDTAASSQALVSTAHKAGSRVQEFDCSWNNITEGINDALFLTYAKRLMLR